MREKRVGLVGVLGGVAVCGLSFTASEGTISPGVRPVRSDARGGFCNAGVGGMSMTCFMNVAMARSQYIAGLVATNMSGITCAVSNKYHSAKNC